MFEVDGGNLVWMDHVRLPKQIYGERKDENRQARKSKLRVNDCIKYALTQTQIPDGNCEKEAKERDGWKKTIQNGCLGFKRKKELRKGSQWENLWKVRVCCFLFILYELCRPIKLSEVS